MKHFGVLTCSLRDYEKGRRTNETGNDRIEVVRKNGHLWVHHNQRERRITMGRTKVRVDYLMEYADEIQLLRDGLSLRKVRRKTGRAINTLRKLKAIFKI